MMKIASEMSYFHFDIDAFSKTVVASVERQMRNAARAFVRAALVNVPIDSGMARGSYLNISRLIRKLRISFDGVKSINKKYLKTGQTKSPELGASLAIPSDEILTRKGNTFIFTFGQDIFHYNLNEFTGGHAPTAPWESYQAGLTAFTDYMEKYGLRRLPSFGNFLVRITVSVKNGSITRQEQRVYAIPVDETEE